jgi:hypothetical protein
MKNQTGYDKIIEILLATSSLGWRLVKNSLAGSVVSGHRACVSTRYREPPGRNSVRSGHRAHVSTRYREAIREKLTGCRIRPSGLCQHSVQGASGGAIRDKLTGCQIKPSGSSALRTGSSCGAMRNKLTHYRIRQWGSLQHSVPGVSGGAI